MHKYYYLYNIKIAKIILLYLAASIIVLHSLLPHQHHDEMDNSEHTEEHATANGFVDHLLLMFHVDLGDGHMENFENANGFDLTVEYTVDIFPDLVQFSYYPLLLGESFIEASDGTFVDDIPIPKQDVIAHLDLRGPPLFV